MNPPPIITEREVSRQEALAGLEAKAIAEQQGGDPSQISALSRVASAMPAAMPEHRERIGGVGLHPLALLPILCTQELQRLAAKEPSPPAHLLTIARLAACLHHPHRAWQDLTSTGLAALDAWAVPLVAAWQPADVQRFHAYVEQLKQQTPSLEAEPDTTPGKPARKVKRG